MKTKVCNKCCGAAFLVAALLVGCVPGEATISVKPSELANAVAGRIGWAEADFLAFAGSKNSLLATNSFVNVGSGRFEKGRFSMSTEGAVNFISYCDIQNNGGGIHLVYDRDKKILRGFYSHH